MREVTLKLSEAQISELARMGFDVFDPYHQFDDAKVGDALAHMQYLKPPHPAWRRTSASMSHPALEMPPVIISAMVRRGWLRPEDRSRTDCLAEAVKRILDKELWADIDGAVAEEEAKARAAADSWGAGSIRR